MIWFNILIALCTSRDARAIVWRHFSALEKAEIAAAIASLMIGIGSAITAFHDDRLASYPLLSEPEQMPQVQFFPPIPEATVVSLLNDNGVFIEFDSNEIYIWSCSTWSRTTSCTKDPDG